MHTYTIHILLTLIITSKFSLYLQHYCVTSVKLSKIKDKVTAGNVSVFFEQCIFQKHFMQANH